MVRRSPATAAWFDFYNGAMIDTTTRLRLLLANVIADAGAVRAIVSGDIRESGGVVYLLQEVDRLQATAQRIVAFLDEGRIDTAPH